MHQDVPGSLPTFLIIWEVEPGNKAMTFDPAFISGGVKGHTCTCTFARKESETETVHRFTTICCLLHDYLKGLFQSQVVQNRNGADIQV